MTARQHETHPEDPRQVPRAANVDPSFVSVACGLLMFVGAFSAAVRFAGSDRIGRIAGAAVVLILGSTGIGAALGSGLGLGLAFLTSVLWMFSVSALGIQGRMPMSNWLGWIAWSTAVIGTSLAARPKPAVPQLGGIQTGGPDEDLYEEG